MKRNTSFSGVQEMATAVETFLFIEEKAVAQSNTKLISSIMETLDIEFNQQRYEEYLFSGSSSSKFIRRYNLNDRSSEVNIIQPNSDLLGLKRRSKTKEEGIRPNKHISMRQKRQQLQRLEC